MQSVIIKCVPYICLWIFVLVLYLDNNEVIVNDHSNNPVGSAEKDADDRDDLAFCKEKHINLTS